MTRPKRDRLLPRVRRPRFLRSRQEQAMAKRSDKPDKMTQEQRKRLLAAGERLLALNFLPETFLEGMASSEEALREQIGEPEQTTTEALSAAVRDVAGAWASPSVLSRLAELRNEVGACTDYLRRPTPGSSVWKRYAPAMEIRLRLAENELRRLSRALSSVPAEVSAEDAKRYRAVAKALDEMLTEADLREAAGLTAKNARSGIAKDGVTKRKSDGDRWTDIEESLSRKFRRHKEARALFHRIRQHEKSRT